MYFFAKKVPKTWEPSDGSHTLRTAFGARKISYSVTFDPKRIGLPLSHVAAVGGEASHKY